jgi:hypothetical protein
MRWDEAKKTDIHHLERDKTEYKAEQGVIVYRSKFTRL